MSLRRPVAAFLLATTPACMATSRVAPAPYLATNHPAQMVVLDDQGSMHLLGDPAMVGDTLVGIEIGTEDTLSLPVSQVQQAVVQAKSPLKTAMLIGGLTALTGLAVVGIVVAGQVCNTRQRRNNDGRWKVCSGNTGRGRRDVELNEVIRTPETSRKRRLWCGIVIK